MPMVLPSQLEVYIEEIKRIYGSALKAIILYGSYARGDFRADSDIDIMILVDRTDMELKEYRHQLSAATYDFNELHGLDVRPIAKSSEHFKKWEASYPFYSNIKNEGVVLYGAVSDYQSNCHK